MSNIPPRAPAPAPMLLNVAPLELRAVIALESLAASFARLANSLETATNATEKFKAGSSKHRVKNRRDYGSR